MPLHVGDDVFHLTQGVGHIADLVEKQLQGEAPRRYFEVVTQNSTIWVPADVSVHSLRPLTTQAGLESCRTLLRSNPAPLTSDPRKRHTELAERLKVGSIQANCEVVRDLTWMSWQKPLGMGDASWLRRARESLVQEWAASEGVSTSAAGQEIEALLVEAHQMQASES